MKYWLVILCSVFGLAACNSVYIKPGTLDTDQKIYAVRGGFGMRRSAKEVLEKRGHKVIVGRAVRITDVLNEDVTYDPNDKNIRAKYVMLVTESKELFMPWCIFNGFWWWRFNISIADQKTGEEILSWRGRGCQNSSLKKFNEILDELEKNKRK